MADDLDIRIKTLLEADEQASSSRIKSQISAIEAALKGTPLKVQVDVDTTKVKAAADKVKKEISGVLNSQIIIGGINPANNLKTYDVLINKVQEFQKTVNDTLGKLASTSITHDLGSDDYKALLNYQTGLGKTTQFVMQLDSATQQASINQIKMTNQIAKAEEQKQKSIEATKNYLVQQENAIKNLESRAFNQKNPLDADHSSAFIKAVDAYKEFIGGAGDTINTEFRRNAQSMYEDAKRLLSEAKAAQYGATENRSKDVSQEKVFQENRLKKFVAELQSTGRYTEEVKASTDALALSMKSVTDAAGLEKWIGELKNIKSNAELASQSLEAMALKQAAGIEANQLTKISDMLANPAISDATSSGISGLRSEIQSIGAEYQNVIAQLNSGGLDHSAFSQLNLQIDELDKKLKAAGNSYKIFDGSFKSNQNLAKVTSQIQTLQANFEAMKKNWSAYKGDPRLVHEVEQFGIALQNVDAMNFGRLKAQFGEVQAHIKKTGRDARSLGDEFKNSLSKFTQWFSATSIIMTAWRGAKDVVQSVSQINAEMIELKKVTDETSASYDAFLKKASQRAPDIGTSIPDYISSTSTFSRLGFNLDDSQNLAEVANIYYRVGDEISNIDDATKSVISTMQAFNVSVDDSISIVDKLNEAGNRMSISSGGIGSALQNSASALAEANNSLDESIALISAANRVAQDPEAVGEPLCPAA